MIKPAPKAHSLLAVLLIAVMAFLLCAGPVSAKVALGLPELTSGESWPIASLSDCLRWKKSLSSCSRVLENSDVPENNLPPRGTSLNQLLDQQDLDRFAEIRTDLNLTSNTQLKRNIAIGEGHIDGVDIGEVLGVSGRRGPGVELPENRIFTTTIDGHPRDLDSEVFVLENIAQRISPNSKGTIRLLSEREVCQSCAGVIKQFREKFPNINLIVRAGSE